MNVMENVSRQYVGYEYMEMKADRSKASMYIDGYGNFGWKPDKNVSMPYIQTMQNKISLPYNEERVCLRFKRDRKIINKTELTRLQKNFEDCMNQIEILEKSRFKMANIAAISTGVIGTVFMAGATFAVTASPPVIWLCVLLAVPGFAGWILPYFFFKAIVSKRTKIVDPLIEGKYDEIYEICEKGSRLLGTNEEK